MAEKSEQGRSVEFSAKTVEDALRQATQHFGVPTYRLDYEIARDSTRSILGIVRTGEVTVRAWVRDLSRRQVETPPSPSTAAAKERSTVEEPLVVEEEPPVEDTLEDDVEEEVDWEEDEDWEEDDLDLDEENDLDEDWEEEEELEEEDEELEAAASDAGERNPPELEKEAQEVLTTLLDKMGVFAAVEVAQKGGVVDPESDEIAPLVLNIVGDDLGSLIGRRGASLRDLQFIVRLILSRRLGVWPNIVIDVEGYKARRVEALRTLAQRMADQVRSTGRMVTLEPMPAHERRIVHLCLRNDQDVYTESTGEDEGRKVQIIPR